MIVVCSCIPALGHFHPMLPAAKALKEAGHEIIFATGADLELEVKKHGFKFEPVGITLSELIEAADSNSNAANMTPGQKAALMFTSIAPRKMYKPLVDTASRLKADILLHEEGEYIAPLVAEELNIPNVVVGWPSPMRDTFQLERLAEKLAELWLAFGREPAPMGGMFRYLFLDPCPQAIQTEFGLAIEQAHPIRPIGRSSLAPSSKPEWLAAMPNAPLVHVTFGTVEAYNNVPQIYENIIAALGNENINLVMTVGEHIDPQQLSTSKNNIHISRYIPHENLLPYCDVVVCHGGCGSTVSALAHGLPLVIIPRGGAVQMRNAESCNRVGVGKMILVEDASVENLRDVIKDVLLNPEYTLIAKKIAKDIELMPQPTDIVPLIEKLAN